MSGLQVRTAAGDLDAVTAQARLLIERVGRHDQSGVAELTSPRIHDLFFDVTDRYRSYVHTYWTTDGLACKKSPRSVPGSPVYACRVAEREEEWAAPSRWWWFFTEVEGEWTMTARKLATSKTDYEIEQKLLIRTVRILDLAWDEAWSRIDPYVSDRVLASLQGFVSRGKDPDLEPRDDLGTSSGCTFVREADVDWLGRLVCDWVEDWYADDWYVVEYRKRSDGRWIAARHTSVA